MLKTKNPRVIAPSALLAAALFVLTLAGCATRQLSPVTVERWGNSPDGKSLVQPGK